MHLAEGRLQPSFGKTKKEFCQNRTRQLAKSIMSFSVAWNPRRCVA